MRNFLNNHLTFGSRVRPLVAALALCVGVTGMSDVYAATQPKNKTAAAEEQVSAKAAATVKNSSASKKRIASKQTASKQKVARSTRHATAKRTYVKARRASTTAVVPSVSSRRITADETLASSMIGRPGLQSRAALIMNADTGEVLYGKNSGEAVPIASITKLMTSIVVLDAHQNMDEILTITEADVDEVRHSSSRMRVGTQLPRRELMNLALMSSENRAASALARNYPGGLSAAIRAMNAKAAELGMTSSRFYDGTGLNAGNRASLFDLAKMVKAANSYPQIHEFSTTSSRMVSIAGLRNPIKYMNTNPLVNSPSWDIGVTKTGYIKESGKCLVMHARIASVNTVLVLMDSWGSATRVGDANRVKQWMESSYRLASNTATRRFASNQRL